MATVVAVMIVKDEEKLLAQCLESIKDVVDDIVIVDTGSTDRTIEIARQYTDLLYEEQFEMIEVEGGLHIADFSKARNCALSKVPAEIDYVFIIDADEKLIAADRQLFRQAVDSGKDLVQMRIMSDVPKGQGQHWSVRLWKNGVAHYEGAKHNQVCWDTGHTGGVSQTRIHHYGYDLPREEMEKKWAVGVEMLKRQLQESPGDSFATVNLIQVYRNQRKFQEIIDIVENFDHSTHTPHTRPRMIQGYIFALMCIGKYDEAYKHCTLLLRKDPHNIDALYYLGIILGAQGKPLESIACMKKYLVVLEVAKRNPQLTVAVVNSWGAAEGALLHIGVQLVKSMRSKQLMLVDVVNKVQLTGGA